jgi:hypothetical protein
MNTLPCAASPPANRRVLATLKDGYWDRTEVIELPDGSCRVRKQSKGAAFGPWGVRSLRREIRYLASLPEKARSLFPPVLAAWEGKSSDEAQAGYEMPFYPDHEDAGKPAKRGELTQREIDAFQDVLSEAVLERLHEPMEAEESLAAHMTSVVEEAWAELEKDSALAALIHAESIDLNGEPVRGPRAAFECIRRNTEVLASLDAAPSVRLHGDFFLENILWRRHEAAPAENVPRLILIDPVSVAGVMCGPPVFDLVKYVSYATGELPALRSEWLEAGGTTSGYHYRIRWEDAGLQPFLTLDWHSRFQRAFEAQHGLVDRRHYQLIDGYFSAAMAVNTRGLQRLARLLKATCEFNAVLSPAERSPGPEYGDGM